MPYPNDSTACAERFYAFERVLAELGISSEVATDCFDWLADDGAGSAWLMKDQLDVQQLVRELRARWAGDEFDTNIALAHAYLDRLPGGVRNMLVNARHEGTSILNQAQTVARMATLEVLQRNPV